MRIVGGKYRGKKLIAPEGSDIRPTSDRAREAVFNILYSAIGGVEGKRVLDVFAGTGALGLEALSRGASEVCFVDKNTDAVLKNAALFCEEKEKIKVLRADATKVFASQRAYNLLFSDAPYDQGLNEKALEALASKGFLEDGAICVVETRRGEQIDLPDCFELFDERLYGMAKVWFYVFHL